MLQLTRCRPGMLHLTLSNLYFQALRQDVCAVTDSARIAVHCIIAANNDDDDAMTKKKKTTSFKKSFISLFMHSKRVFFFFFFF